MKIAGQKMYQNVQPEKNDTRLLWQTGTCYEDNYCNYSKHLAKSTKIPDSSLSRDDNVSHAVITDVIVKQTSSLR